MNKRERYTEEWEQLDREGRLVILNAIGLDPGAYLKTPFSEFPKWAQDRIMELDD